MVCPACGQRVVVRSSEGQSLIFRTMYGKCTNLGCGQNLKGSFYWEYRLNESKWDGARVTLPLAPSIERMRAFRDSCPATDQPDLFDMLDQEAAHG